MTMDREELLLLLIALGDDCESPETALRKRRRMTRPRLAEELREMLLADDGLRRGLWHNN